MIRTLTLAALAAALVAPTARAQQTAGKGAVSDPLFASAAVTGGMAEVSISQLGDQRATDPELKKFSQQMIAEHTRINQELATLAARKGIALPRTLDSRAQFCAQSLAGLSGEDFDRCYSKAQCVAHMETIGMFEAESERGQDADFRALAAKYVPRLKEHLNTIKPIAKRFEKEEPEEKRTDSDKPEEKRTDSDKPENK